MDKQFIKRIVRDLIIKLFIKKSDIYYVPIAVSNRHAHLSEADVEKLFGKGYILKPVRQLSQPGQYICDEKITVVGPKGTIKRIRVLGPPRKETQIEISKTDSYSLGIKPAIRMSGNIEGTPGGKLIGPNGTVELAKGIIISERHLHMSDEEASLFRVKNGEKVRVIKTGERGIIFDQVIVRAGDGHSLEVHIDTDEANAANISCGELLQLEKISL